MRTHRLIVVVVVMVAAACSSTSHSTAATTRHSSVPAAPPVRAASFRAPSATPLDSADSATLTAAVGSGTCDPLDTTSCLLPFPSDYFTTPDATTDTKLHVALPTGQFANVSGQTFDPTQWNRNDGFSPGTPILVHAPGVDLAKSHLPTQGDIALSMSAASGSVMVDLDTGKRLAHWAELDAAAPNAAEQLLIIHPAATLPDGHHIAIGFRNLRTASGSAIPTTLGFRVYRDDLTTAIAGMEPRRAQMEQVFKGLGQVGVARSSLWMAWRFTIASERNLSERLLTMRKDAFGRIGTKSPTFHVDQVVTDPSKLHDGIARIVHGTFDVPSYLSGTGEPGSLLVDDPATGLPTYAGYDFQADFTCQVPTSAVRGGHGSRMVVYGHGLLGDRSEVETSHVAKVASTDDMTYCATDWLGMSAADIGEAAKILADVSLFPAMADRGMQGILDTLFLARAMISPTGFGTDPAFQDSSGKSIVDGTQAYYDGNSQGSLMGGAATAFATDWTKANLGVASMDYSILLSRSVDFSQYFAILQKAYPDRITQEIGYGILQMLWDRIEVDGYAQHLTNDPLPATPKHQVILDVAFGDHQVSNVTSEMEARSIGAKIRQPALAAGRNPDAHPYYGLASETSYPTKDSLLVYWDAGTLPEPSQNITPAASAIYRHTCGAMTKDQQDNDARCADPHEDPRRQVGTIRQKNSFFRPDGEAIDPCPKNQPCKAVPSFKLNY